jgi:hypothetical protein
VIKIRETTRWNEALKTSLVRDQKDRLPATEGTYWRELGKDAIYSDLP